MHYTSEMHYMMTNNIIKRRNIKIYHYCPICKKDVFIIPSVELKIILPRVTP